MHDEIIGYRFEVMFIHFTVFIHCIRNRKKKKGTIGEHNKKSNSRNSNGKESKCSMKNPYFSSIA